MHAPETPASASSSTGRSASGQVEILDDLIRLRAADATQSPILAYPRHDEAFSYAYFRGRDLDTMTDRTSRERMEDDIVPVWISNLRREKDLLTTPGYPARQNRRNPLPIRPEYGGDLLFSG